MSFFILLGNIWADGSVTTRSKCKSGVGSEWKYEAFYRCGCNIYQWQRARKWGCSFTGVASAQAGNGPNVWSNAKNGPGSNDVLIWGQSYRRGCTHGNPVSDLFMMVDELDTNGQEGWGISHGEVEFDSILKKIYISNINGYFNQSFQYMESQFKITIWLPADDVDSVITSEKVKWEGYIYLMNGSITASNFSLGTEYTTTDDSGKTVLLNNFQKVITLSGLTYKDFNNCVVTMSHHNIDRSDLYSEFLVSVSEEKLAADNIEFKFSKFKENSYNLIFSDNNSSIINVDIFDLSGKRLFFDRITSTESGTYQKELVVFTNSTIIIVRIETENGKVYYKKFSTL